MAELAEPLAEVTFRQLLRPLALLCGCIVAFGIVYVIDKFVRAMFGTVSGVVGWIPYLGHLAETPIHKIEQKLTNALGSAEAAIDAQIGSYLHTLAHLPAMLGNALLSTAEDLWIIAAFAATLLDPREWRKLYDSLVGKTQAQLLPIGTNAKVANARSKALTRSVAHGVLPRLGRLEHEVTHTIDHDIASLRARTRTIENEYTRLNKWLRAHPWTIVTDAFVGAVAIALTRLGLSWIRCPSLGRLGKRFGCAPWQLLEELLAASLTAFAVADLCTFANVAMDTAVLIRPALLELVDVEDALVGCHGASGAPPLEPVRLRLPPNSRNLPLAA